MDGGGVLYDTKDPATVAMLIDALVADVPLREGVLQSQDAALERLIARDFGGTLLKFVDQVRQAPRLPPCEVAWDFWQQFDLAERLEELRLLRPSIYRGLPKHPSDP